jgi:hypothetical protein
VEILNLGGASENNSSAPKAGKKLRVLLGIGALAAVTGIGSTLAANISLNGGNDVEFGQGVVTTAACDGTIDVAPVSTFVNSDGATPTPSTARFDLGSIDFSGIDITAQGDPDDSDIEGCDGKTFTIKAFGDTSSTPLVLVNSTVDEILVSLTAGTFAIVGAPVGGVSISANGSDGFTITLDNSLSPIGADQVYKITVESSDTSA